MSGFSAIDLTKLAAPDVIEELDYEVILAQMINDLKARDPGFDATLESDPVVKILEVAAYRETLLRSRVNNASRAVMLPYAKGSDLDNLAAFFKVKRQIVDPGDENVIPPIPPVYESDDRLRKRTQLSLEGHSTAGPVGSYIYHTLAASAQIKDVDVASPAPGEVVVTVLTQDDDGVPDDELLEMIYGRLNAKDVRPLTDHLTLSKPEIIRYHVRALLYLYDGPDAKVVRELAQEKLNEYVNRHHLLGNDITLSGLYAALHREGVQRVELIEPVTDIVVDDNKAALCELTEVLVVGRDE